MNGDVIAFFLVVGVPLIAAFVVIWLPVGPRRESRAAGSRSADRASRAAAGDSVTRADIDEFSRRVNGGGGEK